MHFFLTCSPAISQIRISDNVGSQRSEIESILLTSGSSTLETRPIESFTNIKVGYYFEFAFVWTSSFTDVFVIRNLE